MKTKIASILLALVMAMSLTSISMVPVSAAATLYWPVPGHTSLSQGWHDGNAIDINDGSINGAPVIAAIGGTVKSIFLCGDTHLNYGDCNGFGTGLIILGDDNRLYQYAHMQGGSIPASVYYGARVNAGQLIGRVGNTGYSTGPHLHFAIANSTTNAWASGTNPLNESYIYTSGPVDGGGEVIKPTLTWSGERCEPDSTNTFVYAKITPSVKGTWGNCGVIMWDLDGNVVATKDEYANGGNYLEMWYNITEEIGVVLNSASKYTYQFYVVFNGETYYSDVHTFSTLKNPNGCDGVNSCSGKKFVDMPGAGTWSHDSIDYVVGQGLFGGVGDGKFAPTVTMSRAMLVTVLHRFAGAPAADGSSFTDVERGSWYAAAVDWASANGIVNGIGGNKFDPTGTVTREQIASILCRYAEKIGASTSGRDDLSAFADTSAITNWAYSSVQWAVASGIISGVKNGASMYVNPTAGASRAEVATMLVRFINSIA